MSDYVIIDNYSRLGKMGISRRTLKTIIAKAVSNVAGASVAYPKAAKSKRAAFQLAEPISVTLHREGQVDVGIAVNLADGVKVVNLCEKIQTEVVNAFRASIETVPVSVNIKVLSIGS